MSRLARHLKIGAKLSPRARELIEIALTLT
jgi:hypothetical protein